jgi:hypothetical protein
MGCVSSHIHTNRLLVWYTLEDFAAILTIGRWTRPRQDDRISSNGNETSLRTSTITRWTKQYSKTDEHLNFGTSFNSRDEHCKDLGLYANHVEEKMGRRKTWRPWKFISVEEMSTPFQLKQQQ